MTTKAFLFRCFEPTVNTTSSFAKVNKNLMEFYVKYVKPQYETRSAQKITVVKVDGPIETGSFANVKFKTARGSQSVIHEFALADLPCLNPYDWIVLFHFLLKDAKKYEPVLEHVKRMLVSYVNEVAKLDMEVATAQKKKPIALPQGSASDVNQMQKGKIDTNHRTVMFHHGSVECGDFVECLFALQDKHLFSTSCLNYILEIIEECVANDAALKKNFHDMIRWYIVICSTLLAVMPKIFKTTKKTPK